MGSKHACGLSVCLFVCLPYCPTVNMSVGHSSADGVMCSVLGGGKEGAFTCNLELNHVLRLRGGGLGRGGGRGGKRGAGRGSRGGGEMDGKRKNMHGTERVCIGHCYLCAFVCA
jgi:hypothetical protein